MACLKERLSPGAQTRRQRKIARRLIRDIDRTLTVTPCCRARFDPANDGLRIGAAWTCAACGRTFSIADLEASAKLNFPDRVRQTRVILGLDPPPQLGELMRRRV